MPMRRAPRETTAELTKLIAASPNDAELYSMRALEAEQNLDFDSAEKDWQKYIELSSDKGAARLALADFYHRRLEPSKEFEALTFAAREYAPDSEKLLPVLKQRPSQTYERILKLADEQQIHPDLVAQALMEWAGRYPEEKSLYVRWFRWTMDHRAHDRALQAIQVYERKFPQDSAFLVAARAELAGRTTSTANAIAEYEKSFQPLWAPELVKQYFDLLKQTGGLRAFLAKARAGNPADIATAARLFYYWQSQNNPGAAERVLVEFRLRKTTLSADELWTLGKLFESVHAYDDAARSYYALYRMGGRTEEESLAALARLLFTAPEQPIRFGSANLSMYRNVAAMDPHPGFLNAVLSLILNGTDPTNRYAIEEQASSAYFRRMRAAELVALFELKFPKSAERADLRERVIEAYAVYGANDGVIRAGTKFLADFPDAPNRVSVAMRVADSYARANQTNQEFALYDSLLLGLAKNAQNVPLGGAGTARSPEYSRVLDRYVARLVSMKRVRDALALYRREIDRNPKDPGLYETLAAFLDQNKLGAEIEAVYQKAIAQFNDHSWEHKLARWYLREKRAADVSRLTRDVVKIFSGTELDAYFREIVNPGAPVGPALYLQLNLYAHQRFPHHLTFVRNLLNAYSQQATRDDSAFEALLRRHWNDAEDLRARFFERLSRTRRLDAELSLIKTSNAQAPRFIAEAEAWRSHFEAAAPVMAAVEADYPADRVIGRRAAAVERSLGSIDASLAVEEKLAKADPLDHGPLTRMGEMEADREKFNRAAAEWERIKKIAPANPATYLEVATIFWDYYRYDDAIRVIGEARQKFGNNSLFAYEAGAIRENQRDYAFAVREYAKGAMAASGSNAERRLLLLARRAELRGEVEQLTSNLVSGRNPEIGAVRLRAALLRNQNRRDDLEKMLVAVAGRSDSMELLQVLENEARVDGFPKAQQAAIEREVAITADPVDKMRLRLDLARFFEGQGQTAQGAAVMDALYRENPAILGVVRAAVDFHWRNKETKRAVDVLEESAGRAQAEYRRQFTLEAARKSIESADYARARGFAAKLLGEQPANSEYIGVMADAYARAGDDRGLRSFYESKIRELKDAEQIASMRRSLIPVLARMKDFSGAVDQYIEVIKRYPEDADLTREAAQFASANGLAARLRDYFANASDDSPKDFRWPMVLARVEAAAVDYPAAIAAYTRAAAVRPDRADLFEARLDLEMRLLRFDEAAATAEKIYELSYRNPIWMEKIAEIRARQGRGAEAVAALRRAWPGDSAKVLRVAVSWGLKDQVPGPRGQESVDAETAARLRISEKFDFAVAKYYTPSEKFALQPTPLAETQAAQAFEEENKEELIRIQRQRLAFAELGSQLEKLNEFAEAAEAYRASGNRAAELRVLRRLPPGDRLFELLMPTAIMTEAARSNAAVNYVIEHGTAAQARQAITARGQKNGAIWTKAYTSLAGMYFVSDVKSTFTDLLGDMKIGARMGKQPFAGDVWFYYAGRFGEYAKSDDFLPAMVENRPGSSDAYFALAEINGSAEDYRRALELDPTRADVHDRLKEFPQAIAALEAMMNRSRVPQKFWTDFSDLLRHIGQEKALASVRDHLDRVLRLYIRRNGAFQIEPLMEGVIAAGGDVAWICDLSRAAPDPVQFLGAIIEQPWITDKDLVYGRMVEAAKARVAQKFGDERLSAQSTLWQWQERWVEDLLRRKENRRADEVMREIPDEPQYFATRLRVAERMGTIKTLLAGYQGSLEALPMDIEAVREFVYERQHNLLGLAEIRLGKKDLAGAMTLLHRYVLTTPVPFAGLESAASLLEKTGHAAEAAEFLADLAKAEPWNWEARERLASIRGDASQLAVVAKSSDAAYATRVEAARAIRKLKAPPLEGTEPELIALSAGVTDYAHPYWVAARIDAGTEKALLEASAIDPSISKLPAFRAALAAKHDALALAIGREIEWNVEVARGMAGAYQRLGDLEGAAQLYERVIEIEPDDATRRTLAALRARIALNAKNAARRPVVSDNLEQDRLVRARLTR